MIVVYTAVFGHYDKVIAPTVTSSATSYFCLTDDVSWPVPPSYKSIPRPLHSDNRRTARYYKINSHLSWPMADITIWHGGNVQLKCTPEHLIELLGDADMATLVHDQRHCLYDEADACMSWGLGNRQTIKAQVSRYVKEGMPRKYGLYATFLLIRRNTPAIQELNRLWWQEVANGSVRDQISFPYACWKLGIKPVIIDGDIFSGPCYRRDMTHGGKK